MKTKLTDKFVGFFSVTPSKKFMRLFKRAEINKILISYHYIRKNPKYTKVILEELKERGGLFMTDSGIFSMLNDKEFDPHKFDWEAYIVEYTNWLKEHKEYIFCACNMDADTFAQHSLVQDWNKKYFEPLEDYMNIIYVAHKNIETLGELGMVKEYCNKYNYVAVSEELVNRAGEIYQIARKTNTIMHGLAWTKPTVLADYPFFSVDSSSWVNYQKYGATVSFDGRNFEQYDMKNKDIRRTLKRQCLKYGVSFQEFVTEQNPDGSHNDDEGLTFSLCTWREVLDYTGKRVKNKLKHTIEDLLEGKSLELDLEEALSLGDSVAKASGKTMRASDGKDALLTETDESGSEVAIYKPRETLISVDALTEKYGGNLLFCSNCFINDKCPVFKDGSACGLAFGVAGITDPLAVIEKAIQMQYARVERALYFENVEGGIPSKANTMELRTLAELNTIKADLIVKANHKGGLRLTIDYDGGVATTEDGGAPKKGFMDMLGEIMGS